MVGRSSHTPHSSTDQYRSITYRRMNRMRACIFVFAVVVALLSIASLGCGRATHCSPRTKASVRSCRYKYRKIVDSAVAALIAMKHANVADAKRLLSKRQGDYRILCSNREEALLVNAEEYHLSKMSDHQIRLAVRPVVHVNRTLLESVEEAGVPVNMKQKTPSSLRLAAVRYKVPTGKEMLSVLIWEEGKWKLAGFPAFTTGILKYKRIEDAYRDRSVI